MRKTDVILVTHDDINRRLRVQEVFESLSLLKFTGEEHDPHCVIHGYVEDIVSLNVRLRTELHLHTMVASADLLQEVMDDRQANQGTLVCIGSGELLSLSSVN